MSSVNQNQNGGVSFTFSKEKNLPQPSETKYKNNDWISWGKDNLFGQYLNTIFYESPYQSGIIQSKTFFIAGGGYEMTFKTPEDEAKFNEFLAGMPKDHTLEDLIDFNTLDGEIYNGFAIRGVWNKGGDLSFLEAIDFEKIRTNEKETEYYYSDDWGTNNQDPEKTGFKIYKPYNPLKKEGEFLIWYKYPSKEYRPGKQRQDFGLYPKPTYSGGLKDIATDIEMSSYHFHEISNNLKAGTIIYLGSGKPNPKDQQRLEEQIKNGATGMESAGGIIVMYGKGDDQKPEIVNMNGNDLDKRYLMTEVAVQKKIMLAHSVVSPLIFGIASGTGSLGNTTELENGYNIFVKTYVRSRQKSIEKIYNWIFKHILHINAEIELIEGELLDQKEEEIEDVVDNTMAKHQSHIREEEIAEIFMKYGQSAEGFKVVTSKELTIEDTFESVTGTEAQMMKDAMKQTFYFAELLTDAQINLLKLINEGHDQKSAADALSLPIEKVAEQYEILQGKELINKDGSLSNTGLQALNAQPANIDKFEIRYKYDLRSDAPPLKSKAKGGKGSRPFCKTLEQSNKLYTRDEINQITAELLAFGIDRDVFRLRGGWLHDSRDGRNYPFCRHTWRQIVTYNPNK